MLQFIPNSYKIQRMGKKAVDYYPNDQNVPDWYITHKIYKKVVDTYLSALTHIYCYKTQKMCEKAVDTCPFMLECVPNCYKTQEIYQKAVSKELCMLNKRWQKLVKVVKDLVRNGESW